MNNKEKLFYQILETVAKCCSYTLKDGRQSITVADILGRSRKENVQLTRNIAVSMLIAVGFTVSTCAVMMHRSPPAIRSMVRADRQMQETSMVYRMAARQARTQCDGRSEDDERSAQGEGRKEKEK